MSKALFMAAAAGAGGVAKTYVDDVFSTYLYTGNGSSQTITNGIDLAGQGGMVWIKSRESTSLSDHVLIDSARVSAPLYYYLSSNLTNAEAASAGWSFNSNGFTTLGGLVDNSGIDYTSWTFRQAPKFFDVVTFTGNGSANQRISHSLGVAPGCIFIKLTSSSDGWFVYHRSTGRNAHFQLNTTAAQGVGSDTFGTSDPTASDFGVSSGFIVNGGTYVAYLFAHDPDPVDGMIQCGSFTTDGVGSAPVTLGWEPQLVLFKRTDSTGDWLMFDTMRGLNVGSSGQGLLANTSAAEVAYGSNCYINATGFFSSQASSATYVYIAIRRPNKPPTTGTQVYAPQVTSAAVDASNPRVMPIPASDLWIDSSRSSVSFYTASRLTGWNYLLTQTTGVESAAYSWRQETQTLLNPQTGWWPAGTSQIVHHFKRAPGFFDVVCYTGNGTTLSVSHNLGVAPELILVKRRDNAASWGVLFAPTPTYLVLELNIAASAASLQFYFGDGSSYVAPTSSAFTVGNSDVVTNANSGKYVAYLFATLAGISKVGSYTGNGTSQTINCGFTTGARFVLIKRTNTTGDWYVWDTARGIVSGNDPHLSLNTTAAEVTTDDTIDPDTSGFIVNQVAATNVNVNAATYIYLAIA